MLAGPLAPIVIFSARPETILVPISLAVFMPSVGLGGAERVTLNLLRALNRSTYRLSLILMRSQSAPALSIPEGIPVTILGANRHALSPLPLAIALRHERPDIVLAVTDGPILSATVARALLPCSARPVLIGVLHTMLSRRRLPARARALLPILIPTLYRKVDRFVAVSDGVRADYCAAHPFLASRTLTLRNAAVAEEDVHPWRRVRWDKHNRPTLVACGRMIREKGFDVLLHAMVRVQEFISVDLLLVGDGPERIRLEELAQTLGIGSVVVFRGQVPNPYEAIASGTLFVHCAREDALPTSLIEAMALGVPCVATDCSPGITEILGDDLLHCLVTPPGDAAALANAIVHALSSSNELERRASVGICRAARYSAAAVASDYDSLFEEALRAGGR